MTASMTQTQTAEDRAQALVDAVHASMDWDVWGGARRVRYWDALTENVRAATYRGRTVADWWQGLVTLMGCAPPANAGRRADVADLIQASGDDRTVMRILRTRANVLVLRLRVQQDAKRVAREAAQTAPAATRPVPVTDEPSGLF